MNNSERVRVRNCFASLEHEFDSLLDFQCPSLLDPGPEIQAIKVLHHHVRRTIGKAIHIAHTDYMLAPNFNDGPRLAYEAINCFRHT